MDPSPRLRLGGALADIAGAEPPFRFGTIRQAAGLLRVNFPEIMAFKETEVVVRLSGQEVGSDCYDMPLGPGASVEIFPAVAGGNEGLGKVLLGGLLIVSGAWAALPAAGVGAALAPSYVTGALISVGTSIALNGVSAYVSSLEKTPEDEQRGGGQYSGPRTTTGEGQALPLLYGKARVSGALIQRTIDTVAA